MTRKDYELIAEALKGAYEDMGAKLGPDLTAYARYVWALSGALKQDNPRFNPETFRKACGVLINTEV